MKRAKIGKNTVCKICLKRRGKRRVVSGVWLRVCEQCHQCATTRPILNRPKGVPQ